MTRLEAVREFNQYIVPSIPKNDKPALRQAWNNFTDGLQKSGQITARQYDSWRGIDD